MGMYIPNMKPKQFHNLCKEHGLEIIAVLVPPHGRLGDLDRLVKEVKDMAKEFPLDSISAERYRLFTEFIKTAPTIIPAEEGEA